MRGVARGARGPGDGARRAGRETRRGARDRVASSSRSWRVVDILFEVHVDAKPENTVPGVFGSRLVHFPRSVPRTAPRPPIENLEDRVDAADASVGADRAPTAALPPVAAANPAAGGTSASGRGERRAERWPELATRWTTGGDAGSRGLAIAFSKHLPGMLLGLTRFCPSLIRHISPAPRVARVRAPHARRRASVAVRGRADDERHRAQQVEPAAQRPEASSLRVATPALCRRPAARGAGGRTGASWRPDR